MGHSGLPELRDEQDIQWNAGEKENQPEDTPRVGSRPVIEGSGLRPKVPVLAPSSSNGQCPGNQHARSSGPAERAR